MQIALSADVTDCLSCYQNNRLTLELLVNSQSLQLEDTGFASRYGLGTNVFLLVRDDMYIQSMLL